LLQWELPYASAATLRRNVFAGSGGPRVAVVAGVHGDEIEGICLCHRLSAWLNELARSRPEALVGRIELYPVVNPMGSDVLMRELSPFAADLNRCFPGRPDGVLPERIAAALLHHLEGSALVLDAHGSNRFLREVPQLRIPPERADHLLPLARRMNLDLAWLQGSALKSTLRSQLNARGVPCMTLESGIAQRVDARQVGQVASGILNLWQSMGVLSPEAPVPRPERQVRVIGDGAVRYVNAAVSGLFIPCVAHGARVTAGQMLGEIIPCDGAGSPTQVTAPASGLLFTLRELPVVYEGSLLARIAAIEPAEENA
jgi:predicted deacylase